MDISFYDQNTNLVTTETGTSRIDVEVSSSIYFLYIEGNRKRIDTIVGEFDPAKDDLTIDMDGTRDSVQWRCLGAEYSYDSTGGSTPNGWSPFATASWKKNGTDRAQIELTGPEHRGHFTVWELSGPADPPYKLRIILKRKV